MQKTQTVSAKPLSWIMLGTLVGIGVVPLLLAQPTLAQAQLPENNPLKDLQTRDAGTDPFSSSGNSQSSSVFDLIHRATLGTTRSLDDFNLEQRTSINDAAALFRQKQLKSLQDRNKSTPANTTPAPIPSNSN